MTTEPAAPRKLRADAQRNYDRIVAEARTAFVERGADASLDDIAKRAEVGPGTLYRHFPTRSHLWVAVLDQWREDVADDGERLKALAIEDPERALADWAQAQFQHKSFFRGLHAQLEAEPNDRTSALYSFKAVLIDMAEAVVARAKAAGLIRPEIEAKAISQLLSGIGMIADRLPGEVDVEAQIDIVLAGLRPRD